MWRIVFLSVMVISLFGLGLTASSHSWHLDILYPPGSGRPLRAQEGVLDLRGWDFEHGGLIALSGEWEFYWEQLLAPDAFTARAPAMTRFVELPAHFYGAGYATYRLQIILDHPPQGPVAFKMPEFETAYVMYVNGQRVSANGRVGETPTTMRPQWLPKVVDFSTERERLEIILQISNFHHRKGGAGQLIYFGPEPWVREARESALSYELFLFGSLFVMGFYHIALFALRSQDKSPFYLGLSCLLVALRVLVTGEYCLVDWFPNINWAFVVQLNYLSFTLTVPIFVMFSRELFADNIPLGFVRGLQGLALAYAALVLFTPPRVFTYALQPYQGVVLIAVVYFACLLVRLALRAYKGYEALDSVGVFLAGVLVLLLTMVNDILYNNHLVRTGYFAPVGILAFIFAQAFLLAQRFSRAFTQVEILSKEMEQRVVARTEQLADSNRRLLDANVNLQQEISERERVEVALREAKKEAEEHARSAEAASRTKSVFIANMSHELRTPLNAVIGFSQLIVEAPNLTAEQRDNLEIVIKNGENLLDLINDVLDVTQAGSEDFALEIDVDNWVTCDWYVQPNDLKSMPRSILPGSDGRSLPSFVEDTQEVLPMVSVDPNEVSASPEAQGTELPEDWIAKMRQATFDADFKLMLSLIDQIRGRHAALADTLTTLVNRFDYVAIRTLIGVDEAEQKGKHG